MLYDVELVKVTAEGVVAEVLADHRDVTKEEAAKIFIEHIFISEDLGCLITVSEERNPVTDAEGLHIGAAIVTDIKAAIDKYYKALDNREHGGNAENRAFYEIQKILGMSWKQK
jgi:hypothetical protein